MPGGGRFAFIGSRTHQTLQTPLHTNKNCLQVESGGTSMGARARGGWPERAGPAAARSVVASHPATSSPLRAGPSESLWILPRTQWPWGHSGASTAQARQALGVLAPAGLSPWERLLPLEATMAPSPLPHLAGTTPCPALCFSSLFLNKFYFSLQLTPTILSVRCTTVTRHLGAVGSE